MSVETFSPQNPLHPTICVIKPPPIFHEFNTTLVMPEDTSLYKIASNSQKAEIHGPLS